MSAVMSPEDGLYEFTQLFVVSNDTYGPLSDYRSTENMVQSALCSYSPETNVRPNDLFASPISRRKRAREDVATCYASALYSATVPGSGQDWTSTLYPVHLPKAPSSSSSASYDSSSSSFSSSSSSSAAGKDNAKVVSNDDGNNSRPNISRSQIHGENDLCEYENLPSRMKHWSKQSQSPMPIVAATSYAQHHEAFIIMEDNGKTQADLLLSTHMKMGHFGMAATRRHLGMKAVKSSADDPTCHSCEVTRAHATQMQGHTNKPRADAVLKRIFMDIGFGRMSKLVFQVYLDDHSRRLWATRLKDTGETLKAWIPLQRQLENDKQPRTVVAAISRDNDPVYTGQNWTTYAEDHGIELEYYGPYHKESPMKGPCRLWAAG